LNQGTNALSKRLRHVPRFFFHVFDDLDARDDEGVELRDLNEAKAYATRSARHLMSESLKEGRAISLDHRIVVADEQRHIVATVRFADAVNIEG
jgi:hypothetical protein